MSNMNSANSFFTLSGPVAKDVVAAFELSGVLQTWRHRRYERQALATLDEHLLADIGFDAHTAVAEVHKPFWQA